MALLSVRDVTMRFGGLVANDRISFAVEEGEVTPGLASVASAVLDHNGHPVAGVALTYADGDLLGLAAAVRRTAANLGRRLGGLDRQ